MLHRLVVTLAVVLAWGCSGGDRSFGSTSDDAGPSADGDASNEEAASDAVSDAAAAENVPGKHLHEEQVEGIRREYVVYVPEKARGATKAPVVFVVHGTSQDGEHFYATSKWREKADSEGIVVVFPTALTYCYKEDENRDGDFEDPGETRVTTKWASGHLGARWPLCSPSEIAALGPAARAKADHPLKDDVAFFDHMLRVLGRRYSTDEKRVYATGFSNGAGMVSRLALERSDRFAAVAAHAGALNLEPKPAAKPITIVFSVGNLDDRFIREKGSPIPMGESIATDSLFQAMVSPHRTIAQVDSTYTYEETTVSGKRISRLTYAKSTVGAKNLVHGVLIEGCFHQYPNGDNHPLILANALWEVFKARWLE